MARCAVPCQLFKQNKREFPQTQYIIYSINLIKKTSIELIPFLITLLFSPLLDPFSFNNTYSAETLKNNLLDVTCNYHTCRCLLISSPQRKLSSDNQPTLTKPPKGIYIYSILFEQFRRFNVSGLEKIDSLQKSSELGSNKQQISESVERLFVRKKSLNE